MLSKTTESRVHSLIRLDAGPCHNLAPSRGLIAHERGKVFRTATLQVRPLFAQVLVDVRHLEGFRTLRVELFHDRERRTARACNAVPERDVHAGITELGECGEVGEESMPLPACGGGRGPAAPGAGGEQRGG